MSFDLLAPAWLLLLAPVALLWWRRRTADRLHHLLRLVWLALTVLALAQPRLNLEWPGGVLVVVADRSASLPAAAAARQEEIIRLLEQERRAQDRLAVVGFAESLVLEQMPSPERFSGFNGSYAGTSSRLTAALELARSLVPRDRHGRILVLSDGRFTDSDPLDLGRERGAALPVDYRLLERPAGLDLAILSLDLPTTTEPGEAFQFSAELLVPEATQLGYRLWRDGRELATGEVRFAPGRRYLHFQDRLAAAGNARYRLEITAPTVDPYPENNTATGLVAVLGGKPLLHLGSADSRLPQLAAAGGLDLVHLDPEHAPANLDALSRFRGVILENVPATKLGYSGQEALASFVHDLGGGLMVTGGRQSFGIGGYFNSPLGEILPISMELRREHRKLITAVVVVLDRSGSMAVQVPGGMTKMDLANQGTAAVLELLSDQDQLGVLAVDSQAHVIVPMGPVGTDRAAQTSRIRAIQSMGGGIFIYEGLANAARMIANASAGTRHIILFADAADSEEPGAYRSLVAQLRDAGITVSVIGMGTRQDCDAELLADLAQRGGGNLYFSASAKELPQLFAQETLTVSRGAFVEEPSPLVWTEDLPMIAPIPESSPPPIGGYNLGYLRPGASLGARTDDGYHAPLLAFWQHGAGRVLAFTGEVDGKYTGEFGTWPGSASLYLSCLRWIARQTGEDEDWFVSARRDGNDLLLALELDPARTRDPFRNRPRLRHLRESPAGIVREEIPFTWAGRDRLTCRITLDGDSTSHCYLVAEKTDGETVIRHCASQCLPYPLEFTPETDSGRGARTLSRLAACTGGSERLSFKSIFEEIPPFRRLLSLWHLLALVAIVALILEVGYRRLGLASLRQVPRHPTVISTGTRPRPAPAPASAPPLPAAPAFPQQGTGTVLGAIHKIKHRDSPPDRRED